MSRLSWFGVFLTIIYVGGLIKLSHSNWSGFQQLKPNEWGDFLAGALGPLAIFWLILGFFQQGKELQNSVNALKLQAEELKNSVKAQNELAENAAANLSHQIELEGRRRIRDQFNSRPNFKIIDQSVFKIEDEDENFLAVEFLNASADAYTVEMNTLSKLYASAHHIKSSCFSRSRYTQHKTLPIEEIKRGEIFYARIFRLDSGGPLLMNYRNQIGESFTQKFFVETKNQAQILEEHKDEEF